MTILKNSISFIADFIADFYLIIGMLLVVTASLIAYGLITFMFILGGFFIVLGIVGRYFER